MAHATKNLATWEVSLAVLVTTACGCKLTRDLDAVMELVDFMARRTVPEYKLPIVGPKVGDRLIQQFPWLKKLKFHKVKDEASAKRWLIKHESKYGKTFVVKAPDTEIDMGDIFEGISPEDVKFMDVPKRH